MQMEQATREQRVEDAHQAARALRYSDGFALLVRRRQEGWRLRKLPDFKSIDAELRVKSWFTLVGLSCLTRWERMFVAEVRF